MNGKVVGCMTFEEERGESKGKRGMREGKEQAWWLYTFILVPVSTRIG